jgi:hypothetical protein
MRMEGHRNARFRQSVVLLTIGSYSAVDGPPCPPYEGGEMCSSPLLGNWTPHRALEVKRDHLDGAR